MGVSVPSVYRKLPIMLLLCMLFASPLMVLAGNPQPLGQGTGNDQYKPVDPSYSTPDEVYKAGDKDDCHPVEEIVYENQCIPYVEKTCRTSQKEMCKDVYEMVDETYTVQRCTGVTDRVCDTVYDLAQSTKDDFQCVDIDYQYCWDEDKMVKDRTCIFSVDFDCK